VLCAGSALQLAKQSLDEAPYKLFGAVAKLASITFLSFAFSYWIDKPWFLTEGKACCYIHHTFLLGFPNWPVIYRAINNNHLCIYVLLFHEGQAENHLLCFSI
jgi:hypothetical protein